MATTEPPARAVVVGAGLAGLATAAALGRRGVAVTVLERAPALREVGAGLQVTPNGMRVIDALGLGEAARDASIAAEAVEPHDLVTGRRLARFPLEGRGAWRLFHRADLLDLLARAATAAGAEIRLGRPATGLGPDGVETGEGPVGGDLVVGADGIRSALRPALNGPEAAAFTGQVAWRATVAADHPPAARIWMGPGRHVVTYPLREGRVNVVAVREQAEWAEEGWSHPADPDALRAAFAPAGGAVADLLAAVTGTSRWGLFRHPVAPVLVRRGEGGAAALVGDAAHPTLPFLAQGANLALEDAWVLARCAAEGRLDAYDGLRRARVGRAVAAATANARSYHLRGPARLVAQVGLAALGRVAPGAMLDRLDWLYGFDATA